MDKKIRCPKCRSLQTKRDGKRWVGKEKRYQKQIFVCSNCKKYFSISSKKKVSGFAYQKKVFRDSLSYRNFKV